MLSDERIGKPRTKRLESLSRTTSDLSFPSSYYSTSHASDVSSKYVYTHFNSKEALAIDSWFEDLNSYEDTLEKMANTKLDPDFAKELDAIDLWFQSITEYEKTASIYSLLPHLNKVQIRFLMRMMQNQLESKLELTPGIQHLTVDKLSPIGSDAGRLFSRHSFSSSKDKGLEETKSLFSSSLHIDSDKSEKSIKSISSIPPPGLSSASSLHDFSSSFSSTEHPFSFAQAAKLSASPAKKVDIESKYKSEFARNEFSSDRFEVKKSKPVYSVITPLTGSRLNPELTIDWNILEDVPAWLKSLRLHKYTPLFKGMHWKEIIMLDDEVLQEKGVAALGARRKMLKTFAHIQEEMVNKK